MSTTSSIAKTNNGNFDPISPTASSSITYQEDHSLSSSATTVSASPTSPTTLTNETATDSGTYGMCFTRVKVSGSATCSCAGRLFLSKPHFKLSQIMSAQLLCRCLVSSATAIVASFLEKFFEFV